MPTRNGKRSTVDRRNEILKRLQDQGKVKVDELSKSFSVSSVTIRNDLEFLEEKGIIHRIYGGALIREVVSHDKELDEKQKLHAEEKKEIGQAAANMILDGESIVLDSGTTTLAIAEAIKEKQDLTVMTNAINIAVELAGLENITVMLTGGTLRKKSYSLVGPEAESAVQKYYFDKFFLAVDGFDINYALTTPNPLEARLNRLMIEQSQEVIVVTDSSKFSRRSFSVICDVSEIDYVITDAGISGEYQNTLNNKNINVIIA